MHPTTAIFSLLIRFFFPILKKGGACIFLLFFLSFSTHEINAQNTLIHSLQNEPGKTIEDFSHFSPPTKLIPSYSEDFSHYKSFPSLCLQDVFFDEQGKMWLNPCGDPQSLNIHLLQFDGYNFEVVGGALKKLNASHRVYGMLDEHTLIGFSDLGGDGSIFHYDLRTNEVNFYHPPGEGHTNFFTIKENGQVSFTYKTETEWMMYEMVDTQFIRHDLIKTEYFQTTVNGKAQPAEVHYFDGENLWISTPELSFFERIHLGSGQRKRYYLPPFDEQPFPDDVIPYLGGVKITEVGDILYLSLSINHSVYFYKTHIDANRFEQVRKGERLKNADLFRDESGNVLFVFTNREVEHQAILKDSEGNYYDYSAFFAPLNGISFEKAISTDFKQQVLIANEKGMLLHKVKTDYAIQNFLPQQSARAFAALTDNQYIVVARDGVKFILDTETNEMSPFNHPDLEIAAYTLLKDPEGFIWAAAKERGLIRFDSSLHTFQKHAVSSGQTFRFFTFIGPDRIFLLNFQNETFIHDLQSGKTTPFLVDGKHLKIGPYFQDILYGKDGLIWIVTVHGLYRIDVEDQTYDVLGSEAPFDNHLFLCIDEDEKGRLWLGTSLNGLLIFDPTSQKLKTLNSDQGLASNTIVSITPDEEGIRWLGTYNGVSLVSPEGDLITNLYEADGVVHRESNRYSHLRTDDGKIFIGTTRGVSLFDVQEIKGILGKQDELKTYLTRLTYFDPITEEMKEQKYSLKSTETVSLPAAHRDLTIHFAVSNYFKPEDNTYAYRLEGQGTDWKGLGNQPTLHINDLLAGKHRLLLRGSDGQGNWSAEPLVIDIHVAEYFYKRAWFILLCTLVLVGFIALWIRSLRVQVNLATQKIRKDKATIELQAEKLKELDEAKSKFFTNISHEFRTPLTIISGMADQIKDKPDLWKQKGIQMIKQNAVQLLSLVNQILDLRKLESNQLQLQLVQGDIISYLRYIMESFESFARSKGIQLHFLSEEAQLEMDYDPEKIMRIISNLLSNALKFTPDGGHIYINLSQKNEMLHLSVRDTGEGIPADRLPYIFDRFYQVDDSSTRKDEGTGIGLAFTKELIKLMKGTIEVTSEVAKGTIFLIQLPITKTSDIYEEIFPADIKENVQAIVVEANDPTENTPVFSSETHDEELPTLLIVEDNPDVAQFLVACLESGYQLQLAGNGQEGIDKAIEIIPDIIVSDVMMPEKNGFELCETLKKDERTSHVPIILLTAKADLDSKVSGLELGADDYLAKPVEQRELMVRLKNLLKLRKQLQERYGNFDFAQAKKNQKPNREDAFLIKVQELVEENISDDQFGNAQLSRAMNMSESQFYRKIKALTNKSPVPFIRSIRLHKGKELLLTTELNVSEVAYEVGFSDPAYFSRAFSKEFNTPPNAIRN